jgi:hypothetical protein
LNKHNLYLNILVLVESIVGSYTFIVPTIVEARQLCAPKTIEDWVADMDRSNPELSEDLAGNLRAYNQVIHNFLNKKNKEPYKTHVHHMEKMVNAFKATAQQYSCVAAEKLSRAFDKLMTTLKNHIGKTSNLKLGLDLVKHEQLLPQSVRKEYAPNGDMDVAKLLDQLRFRLSC